MGQSSSKKKENQKTANASPFPSPTTSKISTSTTSTVSTSIAYRPISARVYTPVNDRTSVDSGRGHGSGWNTQSSHLVRVNSPDNDTHRYRLAAAKLSATQTSVQPRNEIPTPIIWSNKSSDISAIVPEKFDEDSIDAYNLVHNTLKNPTNVIKEFSQIKDEVSQFKSKNDSFKEKPIPVETKPKPPPKNERENYIPVYVANAKAAAPEANANAKKGKPITLISLTNILEENNPRIVTFLLNCHYNGFMDLIHEDELPADLFKLAFKALRIVCDCKECPNTTSALLQTIVYSDFFEVHIPNYFWNIGEDDVGMIVDVTIIFNRLLKEFPYGKTSEKFKTTLESVHFGITKLITKDVRILLNSVCLNDILQSLNDSQENPRTIKPYSNFLESFSTSDSSDTTTDSFNVCAAHIEIVKNEILKHFEWRLTSNVPDNCLKLKVIVDDFSCSPFYGIYYKLKLAEDGVIRCRTLMTGSLVLLQNTDQFDPSSFLLATVLDVQVMDGIIEVKINDIDVKIAMKSNFLLIENPVLYAEEFLGLLRALNDAKNGEIGHLDKLKPSDISGLSSSQNEKIKVLEVDKILNESVAAVATFPGSLGIDFGVQYVTSSLAKDSTKPVLVLCKSDRALDEFMAKFTSDKIARVGGKETESSSKLTLNFQRKFIKSRCSLLFKNRRQLCEKLKRLKKDIQNEVALLETSTKTILNKRLMNQFMNKKYKQFFNSQSIDIQNWLFPKYSFTTVRVLDDTSFKLSLDSSIDSNVVKYFNDAESSRRVSELNENELFHAEPESLQQENVSSSTSEIFHDLHLSTVLTYMNINQPETASLKLHPSMLSEDSRLKLYGYWLKLYRRLKTENLEKLSYKYENCVKQLQEIIRELNYQVLLGSEVVAMTTVAAITYYDLLKLIMPSKILVLEASNIPEAHILPLIGKNCSSMVLVGDLNGVRPSLNGSLKVTAVRTQQVKSVLELVAGNGATCYGLQEKVEIPPLIGKFLVEEKWIKCATTEFILPPVKIPGFFCNVLFLKHKELDRLTGDGLNNPFEANILIGLCQYLCTKTDPSRITIITISFSQWLLIKLMLKVLRIRVSCCMADHFVGRKNDIILASLGGEVFEQLYSHSYVTSILSMSKFVFYCIGNFEKFDSHKFEQSWGKLLNYCSGKGFVGGTYALICMKQSHRDDNIKSSISCAKFAKNIKDGCTKPCNKILSCGHLCPRPCNNKEHVTKCLKPCDKIICREHSQKCVKKCWEECSKCPDDEILPAKCLKKLSCGHQCLNLANDPCELKCKERQAYNSSMCGHNYEIFCYEKDKSSLYLAMKCTVACGQSLGCGHLCMGKCGTCRAGKMHVPCQDICNRILVCGHQCKSMCGIDCPPCEIEIIQCQEKLQRNQSYASDSNLLSVLLEDCGHTIDVQIMDKLMEEEKLFYPCPTCQTPVANCQRYQDVISKWRQRQMYIRSIYTRGPSSSLLVDITETVNPFNDITLTEVQNSKFVAARQQMMNEKAEDGLNYASIQVLKIKMSFYEFLAYLYENANIFLINNPNHSIVVDELYKLLKWHRILNKMSNRKQLEDFLHELHRVAFLTHIYCLNVNPKSPAYVIMRFLLKQLQDSPIFTEDQVEKLNACVKDLDRMTKAPIKFAEISGRMLTKLPNIPCMIASHWTKCDNGHWYHCEPEDVGPCDLCNNHLL
ncbi:NFX1-type zinc finger-containing protein 1 [Chamberlinius hualienensis]